MLWELLQALGKLLFRKEKAAIAIEGFDRFSARMERRLEATEARLDVCEEDRVEMRQVIGVLGMKVEDCDDDRKELRSRLETLESNSQIPP